MPTLLRPEMWLALTIISRQLEKRFIELTGMTLAEWDERNYMRIMEE